MSFNPRRPIVFLDFDGVLNSYAHEARGLQSHPLWENLDPESIACLNTILKATNAQVVISSTWRVMHTMRQLRERLEKFGFKGEIIGRTPEFPSVNCIEVYRGWEIDRWLQDNGRVDFSTRQFRCPFVIIDDNSDMVHLLDHLVKTSMAEGLIPEQIGACIGMLQQPFGLAMSSHLPPVYQIWHNALVIKNRRIRRQLLKSRRSGSFVA